mgnify:CR=1 FL=1
MQECLLREDFKPLTQQQVEEHYEKVGQGVKEWFDTLLA